MNAGGSTHKKEYEAAIILILAVDCYMRSQDWVQLRGEDVAVAAPAIAAAGRFFGAILYSLGLT